MLNEKRKCFIMYNNFYNQIELLTMTERGELLTAIYKYILFDFISDDLSPLVNMAFSFIRDTVDRDNEAYEKTCKRNAENGRKGGRPKKVDGSKTEGFFEYPKKPDKDIDKDKDKDKDKDIYKENTKRKFIPPTLEEVTSYCRERNNNVDPQRFIDFYESKGWLVGKTKMKDWKACVRTWERNNVAKIYEEVLPSWMTEEWQEEWNKSLGN